VFRPAAPLIASFDLSLPRFLVRCSFLPGLWMSLSADLELVTPFLHCMECLFPSVHTAWSLYFSWCQFLPTWLPPPVSPMAKDGLGPNSLSIVPLFFPPIMPFSALFFFRRSSLLFYEHLLALTQPSSLPAPQALSLFFSFFPRARSSSTSTPTRWIDSSDSRRPFPPQHPSLAQLVFPPALS